MNEPKLPVCPMFNDECRHCSIEHTSRPFTKIEKDPTTGLFKPKGMGKAIVSLGAFCNNVSMWVSDLRYCPGRWAMHRGTTTAPKRNPVHKKRVNKYAPTTREKASGAWNGNRKGKANVTN